MKNIVVVVVAYLVEVVFNVVVVKAVISDL